jgi:F-type H+-transporting ATPase subunit b
MEIVSNIALISINETLFIQLASFLAFMFIMDRIMFKPLRGTVSDRDEFLDGIKKEITAAEKELDDASKKLKESEIEAKNEAFKVRDKIENEGSQKAHEIFEGVKLEIQEMKESAEKEVQVQIEKTRGTLKKETETIVVTIIEKVLDRRISA